MEINSLASELNTNSYPGRGIVLGQSDDGKFAVCAYFIMGRSVNSRNRIFEENERGGIRTKAFDESKMEDPSLTIYDSFAKGDCYHDALITREFEPDAPNYTPRISGILKENGNYNLSILKSNCGEPECVRYFFEYPARAGLGHFIHTYKCDGNPIPSFEGEPTPVKIEGDIDEFTNMIWTNLNEDNKVSLFVRFIDIATGKYIERRMIYDKIKKCS